MKEQAEKEWYKYDLQRSDATSAWLSREAYKAALRREIEKRRDWFEKECTPVYSGRNFKIAELNAILELLDTVEP